MTQSRSHRLLTPLERLRGVILRSLFILDGGVVLLGRKKKKMGRCPCGCLATKGVRGTQSCKTFPTFRRSPSDTGGKSGHAIPFKNPRVVMNMRKLRLMGVRSFCAEQQHLGCGSFSKTIFHSGNEFIILLTVR